MPEQLEDLEVDRMDGVDDPATRRKFIIQKSEDADELVLSLNHIGRVAKRALTRLAKSAEGFDAETVADLKKLANACDVDGLEFKTRKEKQEAPPETPETPATTTPETPAPETPKPDAQAAAIAKAVSTAIVSAFKPMQKSIETLTEELAKANADDEEDIEDEEEDEEEFPPKKTRKTKSAVTSSQADDDVIPMRKSAPKKMGEGKFSNIIFG